MFINYKLILIKMKKQILIIITFIFIQLNVFAQKSINNYKYIIVPTTYSFLSTQDKYQLNSLSKFLFNKYGFTAFFNDEELPQDLKDNSCLALYSDVIDDKGLFKTKLRIDLKDCAGIIVISSKVGETREKDFAKAYNLALRDAFKTFQEIDYKYEPSKMDSSVKVEPIKIESPVVKEKEIENLDNTTKPIIEETIEVAAVATTAKMVTNEPEMKADEANIELIDKTKNILYAQPIENGYQVVDTTPKIVMILLKTAQSNVFIVKDQDAIVYKEEGSWFLSKNNGNKVSIEALNIKF